MWNPNTGSNAEFAFTYLVRSRFFLNAGIQYLGNGKWTLDGGVCSTDVIRHFWKKMGPCVNDKDVNETIELFIEYMVKSYTETDPKNLN